MNLTAGDVSVLPLPAAVVDRDGRVIAQSHEWRGPRPGSASYRAGHNTLVVNPVDASSDVTTVIDRLLGAMEEAAGRARGDQALLVRCLSTSLRLVVGRSVLSTGTVGDALELARAAIAARAPIAVDARVDGSAQAGVEGPEALALILVQLAVNGHRHDGASRVTLGHDGRRSFTVSWPGPTSLRGAPSARRREDRSRWGWGFARIAADALGAVPYPPRDHEGMATATLELGVRRLALPLAVVKAQRLARVSAGWIEETGEQVGARPQDDRTIAAVESALLHPGSIVESGGRRARATDDDVWVAIAPDEMPARCEDVLHGLRHERALWDNVAKPDRLRIYALASIGERLLTGRWEYVPSSGWEQSFLRACHELGVAPPSVRFGGVRAVDPVVCAYLVSRHGSALIGVGNELVLRVREFPAADPVLRSLRAARGGLLLS